ncbi:serine/threonine-protein kinase [Sorangium sp. So ce1097]|uniref:serine/threonine-protein kinase n=1 Tax=Sorangium sp. So ce1097 TaxID=3133330 RepID=UPI003F601234
MWSEPHQPRRIGRYLLHGPIASGGMAAVHLGRLVGDAGFARTVAIKRLHPQLAEEPEIAESLLDEARIVARIQHPNVVATLDLLLAEGEAFLVMDYVRGESLARLLRAARAAGEPSPPPFVASIACGALHGLHAAHEARSESGEPLGIVHRDISPENVLVGVDGTARLLDFGIAKARGRLTTTRGGQIKGKLAYMAPEQILCAEVTRRTDVFAAGVVLWEALAGRRLFDGDDEGGLIRAVLEQPIPPPSSVAAHVPGALDAIVLRALERNADGRYPTARELAIAIEDAVPLASQRAVGEWVEQLAGEALARRAARVAAIESASAADPAGAGTAGGGDGGDGERERAAASPGPAARGRAETEPRGRAETEPRGLAETEPEIPAVALGLTALAATTTTGDGMAAEASATPSPRDGAPRSGAAPATAKRAGALLAVGAVLLGGAAALALHLSRRAPSGLEDAAGAVHAPAQRRDTDATDAASATPTPAPPRAPSAAGASGTGEPTGVAGWMPAAGTPGADAAPAPGAAGADAAPAGADAAPAPGAAGADAAPAGADAAPAPGAPGAAQARAAGAPGAAQAPPQAPSAVAPAPAQRPARTAVSARAPAPAPRTTHADAQRCSPPYTVDKAGIRRLKPECL